LWTFHNLAVGAVVLVLVQFSKINRITKVFASFPKNDAIDDKSIYPDREDLPSVVCVKKITEAWDVAAARKCQARRRWWTAPQDATGD
jgi:hypothetical protein